MPHKRRTKKQQEANSVSVIQRSTDAKRELAIRLLEGKGMQKNEEKAVALLAECVAHRDIHAMLTLGKCYAHGKGVEPDSERAKTLICNAAKKGNKEAQALMDLMNRRGRVSELSVYSLLIPRHWCLFVVFMFIID